MNSIVKRRIVQALLISIMIHIGFLVWSYFARILPPVPFPESPEVVFHVKIDKQEHLGQEKIKFDSDLSRKSPKPNNPFTENLVKKSSIESEEMIKNNLESSIRKKKESLIPSTFQNNPVLRKSEFNDITTTKKVRRAVRENLVELGEIPSENFTSGTPVLNSGEDISRSFLDKSSAPSNTSLVTPVQSANMQNEYQMMKRSLSGVSSVSKAMDLGTALTYQLFKYQDPGSGDRYFKLTVKVRDATIDFPVIPKEIIFLVDASGSIGMVRLAQFEDGIIYSLKHLNANDRFNILVFKDKTIPFSPVSLLNTPDNIKDAIDFLESQKSWSTTDFYDALRASITLDNPFVPSYRVVMTDGFPTTGIIDARRVINEIARINDNKVSIFTFGGGADVDPYMLDFIAFKNRGWSTVVGREHFMARDFSRFYDEIKDPLLLNVRYYVGGVNDKEIFPQTMPDFFKGSKFVVYGRYTNEDKFAIQIRGDMVQEKKEFIVSPSLTQALQGDKQIAHDWAFHKVYYLISQLKYNQDNEALLETIRVLCNKFHIITPYSISFRSTSKPMIKSQPPASPIAAASPVVKK